MITIYTYYLFFFLKQSNRKKYMAISKSAHYFIIYFYVRISFLSLFLIFQPNSIHRFHSVLILSAPTHSATFPLLCLLSHPMLSTVLQELLHLFFYQFFECFFGHIGKISAVTLPRKISILK